MKKRTFAALILAAVVLYIFLFPIPLKGEMAFVPRWNTLIDSEYEESAGGIFPFIMPDLLGRPVLGFVGMDGELVYREPVFYKAAIFRDGFINYSQAGGSLVLQDKEGDVLSTLDSDGFPLLIDNWFLIVSRDRKGISLVEWDGEILWKHHFGSVITAMDLNNEGLLLGFLNGDVVCISKAGKLIFKQQHRDDVIYAAALANVNGGFAVITGLSPQKLSLYSFHEDDVNLLWESELETEYRTTRTLGFSLDNKSIYFEAPDGLVFYDLMGNQSDSVKLPGVFSKGLFPGEEELTFIWSERDEIQELLIEDFGGTFAFKTTFSPDSRLIYLDSRILIASRRGQLFMIQREVY